MLKKQQIKHEHSISPFFQAFLMDPDTLEVLNGNFSDTNLPSCARWPDEKMASKVVANNTLFLASGWGIYRPASDQFNNATILYSDWKMLWNGLHWPTRMAMLLSSKYRQTHCTEYHKRSRILLRFDSVIFASYLFMVRCLSILTFKCSLTTFFCRRRAFCSKSLRNRTLSLFLRPRSKPAVFLHQFSHPTKSPQFYASNLQE